MKLQLLASGEGASIYIVSPHEDISADDYAEFVAWLDTHFPDSYQLDRNYLTIVPEASVFLALRWSHA